MTDRDALTTYRRTRNAADLTPLIQTHIHLVYSVARRITRDASLAEDITQEVFLTFARKAHTLNPDAPLPGWLFTTTRLLSLQTLRAASRRTRHETEAAMSQPPPQSSDPLWPLLAEEIDAAVAHLPPTDRDALLLRYFTGLSTAQLATTLSISEEAAKKRTQRALDSLQKLLTSRGFATTTALTLAATLSTHAVHAAPSTLITSITKTLTTKSVVALATKGTIMAAAKLKSALAIAAVLALIALPTTIYFSTRNDPAITASPGASIPVIAEPFTSPAADSPPPTDYLTAYALKPDQYIAVVPNIAPAIRDTLYQEKNPFRNAGRETPRTMVIQWKNDQLSIWALLSTDGFPITTLYTPLLNIYSTEFDGRLGFGDISFPPDLVFRTGGTPPQYLADLQSLYTDHFKHPVIFTLAERPMDAVVLTGDYHFTHAENARNAVHFYLHNVDISSPDKPARGGAADKNDFTRMIAGYVGQPVVIDSPNFPKQIFHNEDTDAPEPLAPADIPLLLQHLTEQTDLTVTHEKRPIRCLVVTDSINKPDPSWKGWRVGAYPAASPFQAIRWNNDFPEVQVNNTWYQLLTLNDLYADQIVTAAKSVDREWQRRFADDLPALLAYMGHDPVPTASLQLKDLTTGKILPLENIPFTKENRDAIHQALLSRSPTTAP